MRKAWLVFLVVASVSCIHQTIHQDASYLSGYSFEEVWRASIMAVNDIGFTIDSLDRESGFIAAESGPHIGQEAPPRLSILITESRGRVFVNCKVLQKEQYIDIFGHGRRTIRHFMEALDWNLK